MSEITKIYLKEALRSLYSSKQRSLFTLIGVVIGVSSVIAMVSIGLIVKAEALRQFQAQGTDILTIKKQERFRKSDKNALTLEHALGLTTLPTIASSAPYLFSSEQVPIAKRNLDIQVFGVTENFADLNRLGLMEGRFISDLDRRQYFCVIGSDIAKVMRRAGIRPIVEGSIMVRNAIYTVVGVLREIPGDPIGILNANKAIFIPFSTAERVFHNLELNDVTVRMAQGVHYNDAIIQVKNYFRLKPKGPKIEVRSPRQLIEQMESQMQLITLLLGTVGGISLFVGGIGVMNVMVAAVSERRLEIGIKRALGARRRDILWQFLMESIILTFVGGAFGIILGIGAAYVISNQNGWDFLVSLEAVGLGFGITIGTGIFFGFYPSYQAAKLDPIFVIRGK